MTRWHKGAGIVAAVLVIQAGCWGDGEGVSSTNTKGSGNQQDGKIVDGAGSLGDAASGADAGSLDGATGTDSGGSADSGTSTTDAGNTGPKSCNSNKDCAGDEHCGLFYNGAKELTGDDDGKGGKLLPGWANACVKTDKALAALGAACDPYSGDGDESLLACHNSSACQQGLCTGLCASDADCGKGSVCAASEVPIEVTDKGNKAFAFLVATICVPISGSGKACAGDGGCSGGEVCRPTLKLQGKQLVTEGRCSTIEAGKQKAGGGCGGKSNGKGLGKLCGSALCQYTSNGTVAGICTAMCEAKADCPATLSYGGIAYKTACSAILTATNDPTKAEDDVFIPQCILVHEKSSMKDCAADKSCSGTEACIAFAIARGPGQGTSVQHFCVEQATKQQPSGPPKKSGEACTEGNPTPECKGGYCVDGTCTQTCNDGGCPSGMKCSAHTLIARDGNGSATTKLCKK